MSLLIANLALLCWLENIVHVSPFKFMENRFVIQTMSSLHECCMCHGEGGILLLSMATVLSPRLTTYCSLLKSDSSCLVDFELYHFGHKYLDDLVLSRIYPLSHFEVTILVLAGFSALRAILSLTRTVAPGPQSFSFLHLVFLLLTLEVGFLGTLREGYGSMSWFKIIC